MISEVPGHASIAITKDVYGHLLEGDKRAAAESMSRLCSVAANVCGSQRGSHADQKGPFRAGKEPVSWARSEGLEPPAF
jgi:hypothetical protein